MVRMGCLGQVAALAASLAAAALTGSCGGSDRRASESSGASSAGAPGEPGGAGDDVECCCQRYDEEGSPTGAIVSDQTACKSTGGSCTDDKSQCEEE